MSRYFLSFYYYITNLQGDVIGIVDASGTIKAKYKYNAWGEDIDTTAAVSNIETINPLRYRGYYYDSETGLYSLHSRYYDPVVCRFINADEFASTGQGFIGYNMFAYCNNNPVVYVDASGTSSEALQYWAGSKWWLCGADGIIPVGDAIYVLGLLFFGVVALTISDDNMPQIYTNAESPEPDLPDVEYPGDDPTVAPEGYEWRGPDPQGGERGGYANKDGKDSWHPDLHHHDGIEPH